MEVFYGIKNLIDKEDRRRKFIIFPYGKAGVIAKTVLDAYGMQYILVDNQKTGQDIHSFNTIFNEEYKEYRIFLCTLNEFYYSELVMQLERNGIAKERVIDLYGNCFSDLYRAENIMDRVADSGLIDPRRGMLERCAREIYHREVKGNCAEAGVFKGEFAKHINYWFPDRTLYLADTFEGFLKEDLDVEHARQYPDAKHDWSATCVQEVLGKMPFAERCVVKKGRFPDSMKNIEDRFAFVNLDMDLYQPILEGLEYFYPRLNKGGYIMVHDCCNEEYPGARAALEEYCARQNIGYVICEDAAGTAIITK